VTGVEDLLEHLKQFQVDLLFIDDHSTDGTTELIRAAVRRNPQRYFLLERPCKMGFGTASITGFKWALAREYERILEMDGDYSHDPDDVPRLLAAAEDYDLVIGSRYVGGVRVRNWPLIRLALSVAAGYYVRAITGLPLRDPSSGFKCFRREVLDSLALDEIHSNGYSFNIEMNYRTWMSAFSLVEVPIVFTERKGGQSKMSGAIVVEALWRVWAFTLAKGFRRSPERPDQKALH
jgi:dolichol-phosphate mannosyltransferase